MLYHWTYCQLGVGTFVTRKAYSYSYQFCISVRTNLTNYQGRIKGGPPGLGPPIFTCKNFLESYIYPYDNTYSPYIDLKCLFCVCVTVKMQFDNTSTYEYSSYSPSSRSLCLIACLGPPFKNSGSAPDYILTLLIVNCIVPIVGYAESAYSNSYHLPDLSSTEYT